MLAPDVTIVRQVQDARFNRDGTSTPQIIVTFTVGTHGPFTERFAKDGFSAAVRDDKLNTFAAEVRTTP